MLDIFIIQIKFDFKITQNFLKKKKSEGFPPTKGLSSEVTLKGSHRVKAVVQEGGNRLSGASGDGARAAGAAGLGSFVGRGSGSSCT